MTSSEAPWNNAQGVKSTVASGKVLSDQPPTSHKSGRFHLIEKGQQLFNSRKTRMAKISHNVARDKESVEMES